MTRRLARLADIAYRRRGRMVLAWIVAAIVIIGLGSSLAGEYNADYDTPGSESKAASDLTERALRRLLRPGGLRRLEGRGRRRQPRRPRARRRLPRRGRAGRPHRRAHPDPGLRGRHDRRDHAAADRPRLGGREGGRREADRRRRGATAATGSRSSSAATRSTRRRRQASPEGIGFLGAAIVLLIAFGSVVAAGLPLAIALVGLGISSGGLILLLANVVDVPDWTTAVSGLIGIGVGIDYALLVLTRFRAAMHDGKDRHDAVVEAVTTAGRSVIIAGATVVIAVLGLFLTGLPYMYGVAISASLAVLVVMLAAVTLLPALLSYLGPEGRPPADPVPRPDPARPRADGESPAARWSHAVQRRPWPLAIAATAAAARARGAGARHAPRLPRRRQRPAGHDDPPGLRPEHRGLRPGHQRPAGDRRRAARSGRARRDRRLRGRSFASEPGVAFVRRPGDQRRRATRRSSP